SHSYGSDRALPPFPTRRSSDLESTLPLAAACADCVAGARGSPRRGSGASRPRARPAGGAALVGGRCPWSPRGLAGPGQTVAASWLVFGTPFSSLGASALRGASALGVTDPVAGRSLDP